MTREVLGICGFGVVGSALFAGFKKKYPCHIYDRYRAGHETLAEVCRASSIIFLCLPTPLAAGQKRLDLQALDEVIAQAVKYTDNTDKIIVIKSTVLPGTTGSYQAKFPRSRFVYNPEFLRDATAVRDFLHPDRIVIGANDRAAARRVQALYRGRFPGIKIHLTDPATAELAKIMANTLLATIITHNNVLFDFCRALGIDYGRTAAIITGDRRLASLKSYCRVTRERGWDGKCFPANVQSLIGFGRRLKVDVSLLAKVFAVNDLHRRSGRKKK